MSLACTELIDVVALELFGVVGLELVGVIGLELVGVVSLLNMEVKITFKPDEYKYYNDIIRIFCEVSNFNN